ncbi:TPA: hypothetical protein RPV38_004592 [Escherichia coli]|nr:hypothetical protein [Escherichia coli]
MNNTESMKILRDCCDELNDIRKLVSDLDDSNKAVGYINKYAIIRATGSIEFAFKKIIADKVEHGCHDQIKNFIKRKIRESAHNPRLGTIESVLTDFDPKWQKKFNEKIALENKIALDESLTKLVTERNSFAHGRDANIGIDEIIENYLNGQKVIAILDETVHFLYDEPGAEEKLTTTKRHKIRRKKRKKRK